MIRMFKALTVIALALTTKADGCGEPKLPDPAPGPEWDR